MKTKVIKAILVLAFILLFLVGQSSTGFKDCYRHCYARCRAEGNGKYWCKYKCLSECLSYPPPTFPPVQPKGASNCGSTCAMSSYDHLDPERKDMEACVDTGWRNCSD